jgi:hypothetical protein
VVSWTEKWLSSCWAGWKILNRLFKVGFDGDLLGLLEGDLNGLLHGIGVETCGGSLTGIWMDSSKGISMAFCLGSLTGIWMDSSKGFVMGRAGAL